MSTLKLRKIIHLSYNFWKERFLWTVLHIALVLKNRDVFINLISTESEFFICVNPARFNKLNMFLLFTDLLIKFTWRWYGQYSCLQQLRPLEQAESAQSRTCKKRFQICTIILDYLKKASSSSQVLNTFFPSLILIIFLAHSL